jgi:hypothetical protein
MVVACYEFRKPGPSYTVSMKTRTPSKLMASCALTVLFGLVLPVPGQAGTGFISAANRKCVAITTQAGFVLVRGSVSAPLGSQVEGPFETFGPVSIFDRDGNDLTGGTVRGYDENGNLVDETATIEDYGLTGDALRTKWSYMCEN